MSPPFACCGAGGVYQGGQAGALGAAGRCAPRDLPVRQRGSEIRRVREPLRHAGLCMVPRPRSARDSSRPAGSLWVSGLWPWRAVGIRLRAIGQLAAAAARRWTPCRHAAPARRPADADPDCAHDSNRARALPPGGAERGRRVPVCRKQTQVFSTREASISGRRAPQMAAWPVVAATLTISAVGLALPHTPVGAVEGMVALPPSFYGAVGATVLGARAAEEGRRRGTTNQRRA